MSYFPFKTPPNTPPFGVLLSEFGVTIALFDGIFAHSDVNFTNIDGHASRWATTVMGHINHFLEIMEDRHLTDYEYINYFENPAGDPTSVSFLVMKPISPSPSSDGTDVEGPDEQYNFCLFDPFQRVVIEAENQEQIISYLGTLKEALNEYINSTSVDI
jgi:hypothetical protein